MPPEPRLPLVAAPALPSPRRRRLPFAALGLLAALAVFGWGIIHLFELRFAGGDVYPVYSTLRKDPLGSAVFHDALAALPGLGVERNLRPLASLGQPSGILLGPLASPDSAPTPDRDGGPAGPLVCFYLGADAHEWPFLFRHVEFERLDAILHQGDRVVLTFLPVQNPLTENRLEKLRRDRSEEQESSPPDSPFRPKSATPTPSSPQPADSPGKRAVPAGMRREDLVERWGIDFRRVDRSHDKALLSSSTNGGTARPSPTTAPDQPEQGPAQPVAGGPWHDAGNVSWHSVLGFNLDTPEARAAGWHPLYQRGKNPVIIARPVGNQGGELVLASDSYFLSNEALRSEARPGLLAGLIGPARRVIFDETHLGIAEQPGMMTLARRYHLQGGLAALALLAVLFVWRNVVSLVPPPVPLAGTTGTVATITGRDAAAGFLNLLRREYRPGS